MISPLVPAQQADFAVYLIRGEHVVLDAAVAQGFGTTTKRVNQAVSRNPEKFSDAHAFQLTDEEFAALRSQLVTSNTGRGGPRYAPHVYTAKGVARLATVLDTPEALRATDLIIDTFLQVREQVANGKTAVAIKQPSRLRGEPATNFDKLRAKLLDAVNALLETVIDTANKKNVREVGQDMTSGAIENIRQRLRAKGLENTKLEADTMLVVAQAEKVYAETRKAHAEAETVEIENFRKRIETVKALRDLVMESEPNQLVQILTRFDEPTAIEVNSALPAPDQD